MERILVNLIMFTIFPSFGFFLMLLRGSRASMSAGDASWTLGVGVFTIGVVVAVFRISQFRLTWRHELGPECMVLAILVVAKMLVVYNVWPIELVLLGVAFASVITCIICWSKRLSVVYNLLLLVWQTGALVLVTCAFYQLSERMRAGGGGELDVYHIIFSMISLLAGIGTWYVWGLIKNKTTSYDDDCMKRCLATRDGNAPWS